MNYNSKLGILFIIILTLNSCEPNSPEVEEEIPPMEIIEIPDVNFKYALVNTKCVDTNNDNIGDIDMDSNNDGEIQINEAKIAEGLILKFNSGEILRYVDLTGIENFSNLKYLEISRGANGYIENTKTDQISYDFTSLNKLEFLLINYVPTDYIENINISGLNNLIEADLSQNRPSFFTEDWMNIKNYPKLNMEGCSQLKKFSLINSFFKINFCQVPSLEILNMSYLEGGEPDTFDFHCLSNLKWLDISENYFENLILKNSSVLETFIANDIGSASEYGNYPFLKNICIDDIPEELEQISTLRDENTVVTTDCTFN